MKKRRQPDKKFFSRNKFLLLFLFIYIIFSILLFDPKLFTGGDNAIYITLAESIISGKGYKNIYLPEEPPHTQYPFGFPLLLSLPFLIFGSNIFFLKLVVLLTGIGSVYFIYRIGGYLLKKKINIIMPFYVSIPIFITYNSWILSDMPFLCFSLGALYFFIKARKDKAFFYYISFIFATYSFFIRTAGISLIIAMMLFLLLKKQYKYFVIFILIFLAVFVPWQIRNASIPREGGYLNQLLAKNPYQMELGRASFFDLLVRVGENFIFYSFTILPKTFIPILRSRVLLAITGFIFMPLLIIGFVKQIKKYTVIGLYFIFGTIILLGWPKIWSSERFLLPILPILIIYVFFGLYWLAEKISVKYLFVAVTGILVFLNILAHIIITPHYVKNNIEYLKGDRFAGYESVSKAYFVCIELVKKNVPEGKIILARKPEFVYLVSKHKSLAFPFTTDQKKVKDAIMRSDYVIIENSTHTKRYLLPVIIKEPENYRLAGGTYPIFYVLEVKK